MKKKDLLTREQLSKVTAGEDEQLIPAPPPGYKYCDYWRTCPNFNYKVCIFKISDTPGEESAASHCVG